MSTSSSVEPNVVVGAAEASDGAGVVDIADGEIWMRMRIQREVQPGAGVCDVALFWDE